MNVANMSKSSISNYIKTELDEHMDMVPLRKPDFHNLLQNKLVELAVDFNLMGSKEYKLDVNGYSSKGSIDIVWENDRLFPVVSIKVDSSARRKSIKKLLASRSHYKFWICYGKKIKFFRALRKYDHKKKITFIYLPEVKCIGKRAVEGYKNKYNMMVYDL